MKGKTHGTEEIIRILQETGVLRTLESIHLYTSPLPFLKGGRK